MNKDEPPPDTYLIDFENAYRIYRDCGIARDIANIRKSKEENDGGQQGRTAGGQTVIIREYIECLADTQKLAIEKKFIKN